MESGMSYEEYIEEAMESMKLFPQWRAGQAYFNVLARVRPDLAEDIRGTPDDPFYSDVLIAGFLQIVKENW